MNRDSSILDAFDGKIRESGFKHLAGADEAGRGALAGPLVAAAVILSHDETITGLNDSKQLTPQTRESLYSTIVDKAIAWKAIRVEPNQIDSLGIQRANLLAIETAIRMLDPRPDYIIIDHFETPGFDIPLLGVTKGDAVSATIAAASIIAKVTRDRIMEQYCTDYPDYKFSSNKGYGTSDHISALERHGASPIHRMTFSRVPQA